MGLFSHEIFLIAQRTKVHLDLWLSNCCVYCSTSDNEEAMRGLGICQTFYDKVKWQMPFDLDKIPPTVGKDNYQNGFMLFIFWAIQKICWKLQFFPPLTEAQENPLRAELVKSILLCQAKNAEKIEIWWWKWNWAATDHSISQIFPKNCAQQSAKEYHWNVETFTRLEPGGAWTDDYTLYTNLQNTILRRSFA